MPRLKYDPLWDYYDVLGVAADADAATIQREFRQKAKKYHPDSNPDHPERAKEQFQLINDAYRVLNNSDTRQQYNALRQAYREKHHMAATTPIQYPSDAPGRYAQPIKTPMPRRRNPYRPVLLLIGVVLLLNIGFILFLTSDSFDTSSLPIRLSFVGIDDSGFTVEDEESPSSTESPSPSPTSISFEPYDTCGDSQATIRSPQSRIYGPASMPIEIAVFVTLPDAFSYQLTLRPEGGFPQTLKRLSAIGDDFTSELITLNPIDFSVLGVGEYELELSVYNRDREELSSCTVRLFYVEAEG